MSWEEVYDSNIYTIQYPWSTVVSFVCKHVRKGMRVLDVGCGLGNNFQPVVDRGAIPVGLDVSETALNTAAEKYPTAELYPYRFDEPWSGWFQLGGDSSCLPALHHEVGCRKAARASACAPNCAPTGAETNRNGLPGWGDETRSRSAELKMWGHRDGFQRLAQATDSIECLEGRIWEPLPEAMPV